MQKRTMKERLGDIMNLKDIIMFKEFLKFAEKSERKNINEIIRYE